MKHHSRRPRPLGRPIPPPPTRAQVRQRIGRLCSLYRLEAALELHKPTPDASQLRRLDAHIGFFREVLAMQEQA
jgi:hypothetical protein